jgi:hypothetical protein
LPIRRGLNNGAEQSGTKAKRCDSLDALLIAAYYGAR